MLFRVAVTLLVGATLISGCGFHLRGKVPLSDKLATVYVDGDNRQLVEALKKGLRFAGAEVATEPTEATAVLDLVEANYERKVRTVDSRGLATRYQLFYTVVFEVRDSSGETLLAQSRLRQDRDLEFDSTQLLQKVNEEEFLREDMETELVQQILRQLATVAARAHRLPVALGAERLVPAS